MLSSASRGRKSWASRRNRAACRGIADITASLGAKASCRRASQPLAQSPPAPSFDTCEGLGTLAQPSQLRGVDDATRGEVLDLCFEILDPRLSHPDGTLCRLARVAYVVKYLAQP